ncbi:MAG: DUF4124 domain-containing protein [Burkholderiales bacterium]
MSSRFEILAPSLALCLLAFSSPGQAQQTYKWTDAQGKIHYSDQPPPPTVKQSATIKRPKSAGGAGAAPSEASTTEAPKNAAELEADFKQRQVEAAEREAKQKQAEADAAARNINCEMARGHLARVQNGARIARTNAQGQTEYLEDAQLAQEAVTAKKSVESWCN